MASIAARRRATSPLAALTGGNLAEQALSAALTYRTQAPLIDSLLNEIGIAGGSLKALTTPLVSSATDEINREATIKEQ
ncbi:membrane protein [Salmonella enterica subsp. enterica serovar Typhimurium]|nr:membrane protein [Salmonella enterica subsp. enterica serovar Typhimurium]